MCSSSKSIKENGLSFVENSILKARYASKLTGLPALSDDSGLVIPKIINEPGLYSARYVNNKANINNIDDNLANNGYFIGACFDGKKIYNKLERCSIRFDWSRFEFLRLLYK